jgi:hypothetical protein
MNTSAVTNMNTSLEPNNITPPPPQPQPPVAPSQAPQPCSEWQKCVDAVTDADIQDLAEWRGYRVEFCKKLKESGLIGLWNGRIAFPITTFSGQVTGCHHRPLAKEGSWLVTSFSHLKIAMYPLLINNPMSKKLIAAFESQWDALSLLDELGWPNDETIEFGFVITRGALNGKIIERCTLPDAKIIAFGQNDKAGKQWLSKVVKAAQGEVYHVQVLPEYKDLNDWTRAGAKWDEIQDSIQPIKETAGDTGNEGVESNSGYDKADVQETTKDGRIYVPLPGKDNRLMSEFASDMGKALAGSEIYNRNGTPFTVDHLGQTLKLMTPDSFRTWAEKHVVCFSWDEPDEGPPMRIRKSMSVTEAGTTLASEHFLKRLRSVRKLNQVRQPVLRKSDKIELLPVGYDAESRTYTFDTPGVIFSEELTLDEAKAILDGLFAEFCFQDDGGLSKSVAMSGLLTPFAYGILPHGALVPCFIVVGNAEGAGKTLVVKVMVVPVLGKFEAGTKPGNEEELRKALLAVVMESQNCIILDNIKDHLGSSSLEAFLTTTVWKDRILGSSKSFTGEKSTVVFATGNSCTVSPDMRRRSLVVHLFMREERAEARKFDRPLDVSYLLEHRSQILNALWVLIKAWDAAGRPKGSKTHSSFPEWTKTIAAIIEHAGYPSPAEISSVECSADQDGNDMRKMVNAISANTPQKICTFSDLVDFARTVGAFESTLGTEGELDRKARTTFSKILKRYAGRFIGDYTFLVCGEGHNRTYVFKKPGMDVSMPPDLQGDGSTGE